jgi:hypothetical protein
MGKRDEVGKRCFFAELDELTVGFTHARVRPCTRCGDHFWAIPEIAWGNSTNPWNQLCAALVFGEVPKVNQTGSGM